MPKKSEPKRRRGRPESRILKIDATPEELAKCLVTPIKQPDPAKRITNKS